jgi:hypothetical protein
MPVLVLVLVLVLVTHSRTKSVRLCTPHTPMAETPLLQTRHPSTPPYQQWRVT